VGTKCDENDPCRRCVEVSAKATIFRQPCFREPLDNVIAFRAGNARLGARPLHARLPARLLRDPVHDAANEAHRGEAQEAHHWRKRALCLVRGVPGRIRAAVQPAGGSHKKQVQVQFGGAWDAERARDVRTRCGLDDEALAYMRSVTSLVDQRSGREPRAPTIYKKHEKL
jgi:hypothetical protein